MMAIQVSRALASLLSDLHSLQPRFGVLFGAFLLCLAVAETLTGDALSRGRTLNISRESNRFWRSVAFDYAAGICVIGYYLYKAYQS